jgi:hypothetical protein
MEAPLDPGAPHTIWGGLIIAISTLAGVVAYLFRFYNKRDAKLQEERKQIIAERSGWALEREGWEKERLRIRLEFEEKHREVVENYAKALHEDVSNSREREDKIRNEFGELMEEVRDDAQKSSSALVDTLQKFYDRFVGPRPRY